MAELDTLDHGTPIKKALLGVSWAAGCLEYAAQPGPQPGRILELVEEKRRRHLAPGKEVVKLGRAH